MEIELTDVLLEQIDNYIKGTLTSDEHLAFEKEMQKNKVLKEEVALQQEIILLIGVKKWIRFTNNKQNEDLKALKEQLRSNAFQNTSKKIRQIGVDNYKEKATRKKKNIFYSISTVAVLLILISVFFMNRNSDLNSYYKDYANWNTELPSFTTKKQSRDQFSKGEILFKKGKHKEALGIFNTIEQEDILYPYALMYIGASNEQIGKNIKALDNFDKLISLSSFEEHTKGYWYKLLIYLKLNNKNKVEEMLKTILENKKNYHYEEAITLSNKI